MTGDKSLFFLGLFFCCFDCSRGDDRNHGNCAKSWYLYHCGSEMKVNRRSDAMARVALEEYINFHPIA